MDNIQTPGTGDPNNPGSNPENNGTPPADGDNQGKQPFDFGHHKDAEGLMNNYKELQATFTKSQETLKQLMEFKDRVEQSMRSNKPFDAQKWFADFAEKPLDVIDSRVKEIVEERMQEVQRQVLGAQVEKVLDGLRAKYPDFKSLEGEMEKFVQSGAFSSIDPEAMERLYWGVKSHREFTDKAKRTPNNVPGSEVPSGGTAPGTAQFTDEQLRGMSNEQIFALAAKAK